MDWARHACPNASLVSAKTPQTAFVPYAGEDMWSAADVAALPEDAPARQSWAVTTRLTPADVLVETRVDSLLIDAQAQSVVRELPPNFLRGVEPGSKAAAKKFWIYVASGSNSSSPISVTGDVGGTQGRAVYEGSPNAQVAKLFGKMKSWRPSDWALRAGHKAAAKGALLVLWPDPTQLSAWAAQGNSFPAHGHIRIAIADAEMTTSTNGNWTFPDGTHVIDIEGSADLSKAGKRHGLTGALAKHWSMRMKAKFRGQGVTSLAQMFGVRATYKDVTIHLIFQVAPGSDRAQLRDVEVSFPELRFTSDKPGKTNIVRETEEEDEEVGRTIAMTCDPRSLEDCTALAMGLQLRATRAQVAGQPVDAALDNAAGLVRKHVRALESGKLVLGPHDEVPMDVNTAIHSTLASI